MIKDGPNEGARIDDVLKEEIRSKVSIAKYGGYIFHSDHSVPPNVSLQRYQWILETARKYADD